MLLLLESIKPPVRTNKQPKEGVKERRRERVNERELVVAVLSCLFICVDKSKITATVTPKTKVSSLKFSCCVVKLFHLRNHHHQREQHESITELCANVSNRFRVF